MRRKEIALICILVLIFNVIPLSVTAYSQQGTKSYIVSPWAEAEISKADSYGLIPASLKEVDLRKSITREEFAELAVLLYEKATNKKASPASTNPFTDTKNPEILKAYNLGITTGTSASTFSPKESTDREQIATMLSRTIRIIEPEGDFSISDAPTFTDEKDISPWALEHVKFMSKTGIIKGTDGKFMPKPITPEQKASGYAITTREQAIAMSVRAFQQYSKNIITETSIPANLLGQWRYHFDAGVNGQSFYEIEFEKDGTFSFRMAIVVSTGSGFTSSTYGVAASSEGKYKSTGDNKILLYDIVGGSVSENIYNDNFYEHIEKTYSIRDTLLEDIEFYYTVENNSITFKPLIETGPNKLGFGLLTEEDSLTFVK
ncbi:S-layer homology domain-containing protein [Alkaliphilus peptidifermentans]|uniref:S-layer homology domain-containing protein n=1 Tax=Alkaliphilus peptidifermentans DSM 18978 TaxID=1120976 RepID=A0A1G5FZ88_9FIRM|nr:S-layer homology domain-containing protein [Alkaliphilus peptidifermentans]SCY44417.1 S-layer homology domain-containing protein [Alkaliphilus peptidifermentans DSM 18978]